MTRVKVVKNKVAPPFREADSRSCTHGISKKGTHRAGVLHNMVEKSGSWYSYKGERMDRARTMRDLPAATPEISQDSSSDSGQADPEKATMNPVATSKRRDARAI